jgi:hypothetical protein
MIAPIKWPFSEIDLMVNGIFWDVTPLFIVTAVKTSNLTGLMLLGK